MLRSMMCSVPLLVIAAMPLAQAQPASPLVLTRTSCDMYGRCFEFSGPSDILVSDGVDLWQRVDPLALAHGTVGEPIEDVEDE